MPKNWCFWTGAGEDSWESLDSKEIKPVNSKENQPWIFIGRTGVEAEAPILATWCEELTPWKRPWSREGLKAGGEGGDRRQYGWMASPTQWAWVWADSGKQWRKGKPGVLQSAGLQSRTQLSDCTTSLLKDEIPPLNYMTY